MYLSEEMNRHIFSVHRYFRAEEKLTIAAFLLEINTEVDPARRSADLLRNQIEEYRQEKFFRVNFDLAPGFGKRGVYVSTCADLRYR
jgi:hypothetical protein